MATKFLFLIFVLPGLNYAQDDATQILKAMADRYASLAEYSGYGSVEVNAAGLARPSRRDFHIHFGIGGEFEFAWNFVGEAETASAVKTARLICGPVQVEKSYTRRGGGDNSIKQLPPATAADGAYGSIETSLVNDVSGMCVNSLMDPSVVDIEYIDGHPCYVVEATCASAATVYRLWVGEADYFLRKVVCDLGDRVGSVVQIHHRIRFKRTPQGDWIQLGEPTGVAMSGEVETPSP